MNFFEERAPCKANLYLDVVGRRADGYHAIESVMVTLPLCDKVTIKASDSLTVRMTTPLPERDNLAYKAATLFFEKAGIAPGAEIFIEKKIPERAGLGGGSADAAAVLRGLNKLFGEPFSIDELSGMSLPLGADVPFCVAGGAALCRGVGEEMTPIACALELHGLVTSERAEKRSTADAYRMVDEAKCRLSPQASAADAADALEAGDLDALAKCAYNIFGEACGYPTAAREILSSLGAPFVLMSGAGPSVVALVKSKKDAESLGAKLKKYNYDSFCF